MALKEQEDGHSAGAPRGVAVREEHGEVSKSLWSLCLGSLSS